MEGSLALAPYEFLLPQTSDIQRLDALLELSARDFPREDVTHLLSGALALARRLGDEQRAAHAHLRLAQQLDGEAAAEHTRHAQDLFERLEDAANEARSLLRQGQVHGEQPAQALTAFLVAAATAQEAQEEALAAAALREAGDRYAQLGDEAQALQTYQQALTAAGRVHPPEEDLPLLLTVGHLHLQAQDLDGAHRTYAALLRLTRGAASLEEAEARAGLGEVHLRRGELERALPLLEAARFLSSQLGERGLQARVLGRLAEVHDGQGQPDRAAELFRQALQVTQALPDLHADTLLDLAEHHLRGERPDPAAAAPLLDRALALCWQARLPRAELRTQQLLTRLTASQGNAVAALVHQQAGHDLEREALLRLQAQRQQGQQARQQADLWLAVRQERRQVRRSLESTLHSARAALDRLNEEARHWRETSAHDLESGARSRSHGLEQLTRDFQRSLRAKTELSLAIVGLDLPLLLHDIPAPLQSPEVLRTVAQLLQRSVRDTDTVARYDTHKFMVIFPETTLEGAKLVLRRIVENVAAHDWAALELDSPLTVSAGLASRGFIQGAQLLIEVADEYHYRVRRDGGNAYGAAE